MERIVVGIDGSEPAHLALEWAVGQARVRGAALEVVHAWMPAPIGSPYGLATVDPAPFEQVGRATLDRAIAEVDTSGLAAPVERRLVCGGAATVILEQSRGADLVVVGSRGHGGFRGLLLGSVSHQVVHHATCPVVVVPVGADHDR